jgi:isopentenyl phosphate kinase
MAKLGGSLITDKSKVRAHRKNVIYRLANEIHEAREERDFSLVLGHGGGSYAHPVAKNYRTREGVIDKQSYRGIAEVHDAVSDLNGIVVDSLREAGENAISVQPSSTAIAERGKIKRWYLKPLKTMLSYDMVPVVYGDVLVDTKKGCSIVSTEEVLGFLSKKLGSKRMIIAGTTDGVFKEDPHKNKNAEFIPEITPKNYQEIIGFIGGSAGIDVTGGMLGKINSLISLTSHDIEVEIINGEKEDYLKRALLGERDLGTIIKA